jgi:hypothetical protein
VVSISLASKGLSGTLPTSRGVWKQLAALNKLNLAGNRLTVREHAQFAAVLASVL